VPDPLDCTILHLTLGPLDLHLLGLRVQLNEVDLLVTGVPREGILGQLLCSLLNPLDFPNLFQQIADILNTILGLPV